MGSLTKLQITEKLWELKQATEEGDDIFFNNFWYLLQHACLISAREPPTERVIQFCCKFAIRADLDRETFTDAEVSQTGPFAVKLFSTALKYHNANNKAVRFRLCQIVNSVLTALGGGRLSKLIVSLTMQLINYL